MLAERCIYDEMLLEDLKAETDCISSPSSLRRSHSLSFEAGGGIPAKLTLSMRKRNQQAVWVECASGRNRVRDGVKNDLDFPFSPFSFMMLPSISCIVAVH